MIKANFDYNAIDKKIRDFKERVHRDIIEALKILGEMCVTEARENGNYQDQTSNLRSSIGYVIVVNGHVIQEDFSKAGSGKMKVSYSSISTRKRHTTTVKWEGQDGISVAKSYAYALASKYATGYVLIVVAGMHYAVYVEAKGLNVLDSAESLAKRVLPQLINQLKTKYK